MREIGKWQIDLGICIDEHLRTIGKVTGVHNGNTTGWVEMLIVDEAERLTPTSLELLRDEHDRSHLAMILIGMPGIDQRFRHYPQLYSRLGFSHRYRALGRDELLFVLDRHWKHLGRILNPDDFTGAQAIAAIERITRGNFRLLERLFSQITACSRSTNSRPSPTTSSKPPPASSSSGPDWRHRAIRERRHQASNSTPSLVLSRRVCVRV